MISFFGTLSNLTANLLKDEAKISVISKIVDIDADALDRLAETCAVLIPAEVHLSFEGREVALPCTINSVQTDHAKKFIKVVFSVPEKRIETQDKKYLGEWHHMEREITIEVTRRQMSFAEMSPRSTVKVSIKRFNNVDQNTGEVLE